MSDVLDTQLLEELKMVMEDEFTALMDTFLSESARQFAEAQGAWQSNDLDALRRHAHSLKGSSGNVGATGLQALCADLEHSARDGVVDAIPGLIDQVSLQLEEVSTAVRAL